jgi:hypothetical protein
VGIFQHKQHVPTPEEQALEAALLAFGEDYREQLREKGRLKFDQIVGETATIFKNDLDATVAQVSKELKEHIVKQLDEQLVTYGKLMKDAQELALKSLNSSSQTLQDQHKELSDTLRNNVVSQEEQLLNVVKDTQTLAVESLNRSSKALDEKYYELTGLLSKNIGDQERFLVETFQDNIVRINEIKDAQTLAVKMLQQSTQKVEQQYQLLATTLKDNVANEQKMLVDGFQDNMAHIIEHYLLDALGEQYDLKAQLPAIIQQMEQNKQLIMDDMKL